MPSSSKYFNEDFLHFVWKFRLFYNREIYTSDNQKIEIIHPGTHNHGSGPDFINAKIKIGDTLWAGNVEIHYSNQEWYQHNHHQDDAYNNVIIHVVYESDEKKIETNAGRQIPVLSLKDLIFPDTLERYRQLQEGEKQFIPCEKLLNFSDSFFFSQFYESLLFERLERKVKEIEEDVKYTKGSLDDAFLIGLFKYFGAPANKQPFEMLARSFNLCQLIKQATSVQQIEALLFGLAGLFHEDDAYSAKLENEFSYLLSLYKFNYILQHSNWKFSTVRPPNFPTIRIAQLSALLYKEQRLLNRMLLCKELVEFRNLLRAEPSEYWNTHYVFGKESTGKSKMLSDAFIDKLIINVVAPFLFFYGSYQLDENYKERAVNLLMQLDAEENSIVEKMKKLGFPSSNAMDTQAIIELKNNFCNQKRCLHCRIGYRILNQNV
jgi:hypothetical protein